MHFLRYLQGERPGMHAGVLPSALEQGLVELLYPDTLFAPSIAIQTQVRIADVSFWQEDIDFAKMRAAAIAGVIIRAGQRNWVDSRFKENWQKAKTAGLPRGSYFFYDSREDPVKQAELWWTQIQGDIGELVHVADFEESYGGSFGRKEHFKSFLQHFQEISHLPDHRIAVYSGYFWWLQRIGDDPFFRRFSLWLAWYAEMGVVRVPPPWTEADLLFWQYTDSGDGPFYGVSSQEIDLSFYCCDLATFNKRFPLGSSEPPPTGDPMTDYIYSITPTGALGSKVRPEPDTGNTSMITLPFGKVAYGNRKLTIAEDKWETINGVSTQVNKAYDIWLEVLEVDGVKLAQPAYVAEIHLGQRYATIRQIGSLPPPPTSGDLVITQTFSYTGYSLVSSVVSGDTVTTTLKPK